MSASPLKHVHTLARIAIVIGLLAVGAAGTWAFVPLRMPEIPTTSPMAIITRDQSQPDTDAKNGVLLERVMSVSFSDDLFPPALEPIPEPEPPKLGAVLVAVVHRGDEHIAYLRDDSSGRTTPLRAGDRLQNGAIVVSIEPQSVRLTLQGVEFELELDQ